MIHTSSKRRRARKPACKDQNGRTSPTSGGLLVEDHSSCRCSWTKNFYSAQQTSISLLLIRSRSNTPSNKRPSRCSGARSFAPMKMAGQKQLKPCPILERAATVHSTDLVNSSRNLRASRRNHLFKDELPILLIDANPRVPAKNSSSPIRGNFEWFASTY